MQRTLQTTLVALLVGVCATTLFGQSSPEGQRFESRALLNKIVESFGGAAKLQTLRSIRQQGTLTVSTPMGSLPLASDWLWIVPDRVHMEFASPMGSMTVAGMAGSYFVQQGAEIKDVADAGGMALFIPDIRRQNVPYLMSRANDPDFSSRVLGTERLGDAEAQVVEVTVAGEKSRLSVNPSSGRVYRLAYTQIGPKGPVDVVYEYSDWRIVNGLPIPFRMLAIVGGREVATAELQSAQINTPVADAALFKKPPSTLKDLPFHPQEATIMLSAVPPSDTTVPAAGEAALRIVSSPGGAQVYLDNEQKGITSSAEGELLVRGLKAATYKVRVSMAGYRDWTQSIELAANQQIGVDVRLQERGPEPLQVNEIEEMLRGGVPLKRASALVQKYGVSFALNDEAEQRIRAAGGDAELLVAIAKSKR